MLRYGIVLLFSLFFMNQSVKEEAPPFIFTDLDQVAVSLWLAIDAEALDKTAEELAMAQFDLEADHD